MNKQKKNAIKNDVSVFFSAIYQCWWSLCVFKELQTNPSMFVLWFSRDFAVKFTSFVPKYIHSRCHSAELLILLHVWVCVTITIFFLTITFHVHYFLFSNKYRSSISKFLTILIIIIFCCVVSFLQCCFIFSLFYFLFQWFSIN